MSEDKKELFKKIRKVGYKVMTFIKMGANEHAKMYKEEYDDLWHHYYCLKEFSDD